MQSVGSRELKTRLGRYLREVRGGATLVVTDRGRPIAELRPYTPRSGAGEAARLEELVARGVVSLGRPGRLRPFEPVPLRQPERGTVAEAILEDREDRI